MNPPSIIVDRDNRTDSMCLLDASNYVPAVEERYDGGHGRWFGWMFHYIGCWWRNGPRIHIWSIQKWKNCSHRS